MIFALVAITRFKISIKSIISSVSLVNKLLSLGELQVGKTNNTYE